jgi:hypothetical protein
MSIDNLTIELRPNITILVGSNGTSKTSILLAIRLFYHMYRKFYDHKQKKISLEMKQLVIDEAEFNYATKMKLNELMGSYSHATISGIVEDTKYTFHMYRTGRFRVFEVDTPAPVLEEDPLLSAVFVPVTITVKTSEQFDPLPESDRLSGKNFEYLVTKADGDGELLHFIEINFPDYTLETRETRRSYARLLGESDVDTLFFDYISTSEQHMLFTAAMVEYSRKHLVNPIVLLDLPFAMLDSYFANHLWNVLQEQSLKSGFQLIISATSIPEYITIDPTCMINLNRVTFALDYILPMNTSSEILEDIADLLTADQLITFDRHRRVIVFSSKKLRRQVKKDIYYSLFTVIICDPDVHTAITKLHSLTSIMQSTLAKLKFFVVSDQPQNKSFDSQEYEMQWYCIQNEEQIEEAVRAVREFELYFS